jgi:mRNA interferase RelE/StbE
VTPYSVEIVRSAVRELERLPAQAARRVLRAIHGLEEQPRPHGSHKLTGSNATYRLRVRPYRVIYEVDDDRRVVVITRMRHRKDAYS